MTSLRSKLKAFVKTYLLRDQRFVDTQRFKHDDRLNDLRGVYPLTAESIVLDLGGYNGEWTEHIYNKYQPTIYIFEPVESFYKRIVEKFKNNSKIHSFNYGLSDEDREEFINLDENASSVFGARRDISIQLRDIVRVIEELDLAKIDLMKINIEGGEFQVLPRLIEAGFVERITDIQVQFHHFYPDAKRLREEIRAKLFKTHHLTYDYPFVFENWRKND